MTDFYAGMDNSGYPGDDRMQWLKDNTNLYWTGYYLNSPCHGNSNWMGTKSTLEGMGWSVVPIYVGLQDEGESNCGGLVNGDPDQATTQGTNDGTAAANTASNENFGDLNSPTVIYLDVEGGNAPSAAMRAYCIAWISAVQANGNFRTGIYCSLGKYNAGLNPSNGIPDFVYYWIAKWDIACPAQSENNFFTPDPGALSVPNITAKQFSGECTIRTDLGLQNMDLDSSTYQNPAQPS
jgi:glycoside hydrolase-like protein